MSSKRRVHVLGRGSGRHPGLGIGSGGPLVDRQVSDMKIIAIDPGSEQSAFVVWDGKTLEVSRIVDNEEMLLLSGWDWEGCYGNKIDCLVIEQIQSYGMPVGQTIFDTVFWSGRFVQAWRVNWEAIPRRVVKIHICGSMKAKDSNIRQALIDRFGPPGTKKEPGLTYGLKRDLWSAFAVGVTWWDLNNSKKKD